MFSRFYALLRTFKAVNVEFGADQSLILPVQVRTGGVNWEHWPVSVTQDRHVSFRHVGDKNTPKACDSRQVAPTSTP